MVGKNQVIVKDNHGHETKVHRRVIDSDAKVAEMNKELRKDSKRDAQHCMPVKQIPDLQLEKEQSYTAQKGISPEKRRTGPTLRSSKNKQSLNEIQEQVEKTYPRKKE